MIDDDGFADSVDVLDAAAGEGFDDLVGRGFEGLGLVAGLYTDKGLAVDAGVDAVGYGFDFGESSGGDLNSAFGLVPLYV